MQLTDVSDPIALARQMIDIPSVSGQEGPLADAVEAALRDAGFGTVPALEILRDGDAVCARTRLGRGQRLVLAGALACEAGRSARGGARPPLAYDVTWIFYDHEEVASDLNGLGRIHRRHPEWLDGDLALLGEPTCAQVEGGCNGTLRIIARFPGLAAHSARAWMGDNAIHAMAPVIERIAAYGNPVTSVDGLDFRESLSVVRVEGGTANNVIPESASMTVNYRFAPSRSAKDALAWVRSLFEATGATVEVDDLCEGARPGADSALAQRFLEVARSCAARVGGELRVSAKVGWTDVARFTQAGVPAMNFGPGDPLLAHTRDEHVPTSDILRVHETLREFVLAPTRACASPEPTRKTRS